MANHPNYKNTEWYKELRENSRSNSNTRAIRTVQKKRIDRKPGNYILTPISGGLIGKIIKVGMGDNKREFVINEVYPFMVTAVYRGLSIMGEEPFEIKEGFSIPDLMEHHIISCDTGFCELI